MSNDLSVFVVPHAGILTELQRTGDRAGQLNRRTTSRFPKDQIELVEASSDTFMLQHVDFERPEVKGEFVVDGHAEVSRLVSPMERFDNLLRTNGDEHANNDYPHLTNKLSPAVQRLGQMYVHATGPPAEAG